MSYTDYLLNVVKVDKQCLWFVQHTGEGNFCVGADAIPALFAAQGFGSPGFSGLGLPPLPAGLLEDLPGGQHGRQLPGRMSVHFPDGNATIARLLVRWLIPDAVPGTTMESVGMAKVNYPYAGSPRPDGAHSPEQHGSQRSSRWNLRERQRRGGQLRSQRQDVSGKGQSLRHGLLEHVYPHDRSGHSRKAEGGSEVWREGSDRLHQRGGSKLEGIPKDGTSVA